MYNTHTRAFPDSLSLILVLLTSAETAFIQPHPSSSYASSRTDTHPSDSIPGATKDRFADYITHLPSNHSLSLTASVGHRDHHIPPLSPINKHFSSQTAHTLPPVIDRFMIRGVSARNYQQPGKIFWNHMSHFPLAQTCSIKSMRRKFNIPTSLNDLASSEEKQIDSKFESTQSENQAITIQLR
jgi:hypothetical protein